MQYGDSLTRRGMKVLSLTCMLGLFGKLTWVDSQRRDRSGGVACMKLAVGTNRAAMS